LAFLSQRHDGALGVYSLGSFYQAITILFTSPIDPAASDNGMTYSILFVAWILAGIVIAILG
jgi:hypothetical protein